MKEMKTLTIGGKKYEIVDAKARAVNTRDSLAPIVKTVEGESIIVADSSDRPVRNFKLFGKTTQNTTTGAQLLNFSSMKMDSGGTTVSEIKNDGRIVTITGTKAYAMGYIDVDVTAYVGKTLYLTGTKSGGNTPSLTTRLIKSDDTKTYVNTLTTGYTVLSDDKTISLQFIANNTATALDTATTATFTEVMISTVKDAAWEPYTGGVPGPNPDYSQEIHSAVNPTVTIKGGNLIPASYADGKSKTMNGVTFNVLSDGSVLVNGTATETAYFSFNNTGNKIKMPNGWLSTSSGIGCGPGIPHVQNDIYVDGEYVTAVQTVVEGSSRKQFFGKVELGASRIKVSAGDTIVSQRIYPMLCAFENPIDYEPPKQTQTLTINRTLRSIGDICDEIDFERGVFVQRIGITNFAGLGWTQNSSGKYFCTEDRGKYNNAYAPVCSHIIGGLPSEGNKANIIFINANNDIRLNLELEDDTVEAITAAMNDAVLQGVLATPIETPLTEEEIAVFNTLYTCKSSTTVMNNFDAKMEMEYSRDVRDYIREVVYGDAYDLVDEVVTQDKIQMAVDNWLNAHFTSAEGVSF